MNKSITCHYALTGVNSAINNIEKAIESEKLSDFIEKNLRGAAGMHVRALGNMHAHCVDSWDADDEIKNYEKIREKALKIRDG